MTSYQARGNVIRWRLTCYENPIPGVTDSIVKKNGAYPAVELSEVLRSRGGKISVGFNAFYESDCINYALRPAHGIFGRLKRSHRRRLVEKKFGKIDWHTPTTSEQ